MVTDLATLNFGIIRLGYDPDVIIVEYVAYLYTFVYFIHLLLL